MRTLSLPERAPGDILYITTVLAGNESKVYPMRRRGHLFPKFEAQVSRLPGCLSDLRGTTVDR